MVEKKLKSVLTHRKNGKLQLQAHSSIIHNSLEVDTVQVSTGGRRNKHNVVRPMERYSALKRRKILTHATLCSMKHQTEYK